VETFKVAKDFANKYPKIIDMATRLEGLKKNVGVHAAGLIVSKGSLWDGSKGYIANRKGTLVVNWDKIDTEHNGLMKIDILGLRTLSVVSDTLELLKKRGIEVDLNRIPLDDEKVYEMLSQADTVGVFQVESRAQMQTLPKMQPRKFEDLVVEVAIIRPGPIQGDMVHPYLRRRRGEEEVNYLHPLLEPILKDTLGVILFQEQVLKVARDVGSFSPGEGDLLRRAMTKKRSEKEMERFRARFIQGAQGRRVPKDIAEQIFNQVAAFASYGFPASHAIAFARLTYETAWLKCYHPAEYTCALLNNEPLGFYSPSVVVNDAKRHGVKVLPVDVNRSRARCCMEDGAVRLGFAYVDGLGEKALELLESEARGGPYRSLRDFCRRTRLPRPAVENLIMVGAFDRFGLRRRRLLWDLEETLKRITQEHPSLQLKYPNEVVLSELTGWERMVSEYGLTGLSTGDHLISHLRPELEQIGVTTSQELLLKSDGAQVKLAGLVISWQRPPTAKGFVFITLEDERGMVNVIVRPQVYAAHRRAARNPILLIEGHVQSKDGVINVVAEDLRPLHPAHTGRTHHNPMADQ